ncbi:MAG: hypothetical protein ACRDCE_01445 [Cetobacterium sp.]|uniref:hypothetical protein n=1 Tax=Cetobacterium sp. TaxID=2071632 RepID=UPI003EE5CF7D
MNDILDTVIDLGDVVEIDYHTINDEMIDNLLNDCAEDVVKPTKTISALANLINMVKRNG